MSKIGNIRWLKSLSAFFLVINICILSFMWEKPVQAKEEINKSTVLKVAFYPLDGFFEYDENGDEVGYGVDLLNEITQYTGVDFEYVPANSWEITKTMLLDGDADIRMPATPPTIPSETLNYTDNVIMSTCHVIMTLNSRDDLFFQDYEKFSTMKIGITSGMYESLDFASKQADFSLSDDNFYYYDTVEAEKEALKNGEIDGIISNIMDLDDDMKILDRFEYNDNCISMVKGNEYIDVIDEALARISMEEPTYLSDLYNEWYPERGETPLTREEDNYINSIDKINVAFSDGEGFLSRKEDGKFVGFYPEMVNNIGEQLGLKINQIDIQDAEQAEGIVIYPNYYYDYDWADENNSEISQSYYTSRYYEVSMRGNKIGKDSCTVAAMKDKRVTEDFVTSVYKDNKIIWCSTSEDCIKAVEDGRADLTIVNSVAAEYYLSMYRYANLNYVLTKFSHKVCFGIYGDDEGYLVSIINKKLSGYTEDKVDEVLAKSSISSNKQHLFQELILGNPFRSVLLALLVGAIVVFFILSIIFARKTKKKNIELEKATKAKSEFLARMSHDIRTPLNVIIGMNRLARDNDNPEDTENCLAKQYTASEFLLGLINDVLDMERVESGDIELHLVPYSGHEFAQYIDAVIRPLCERRNIGFNYGCTFDGKEETDFVLMQDKLHINQIYFNLLSNAVKYTPEGGTVSCYTTMVSAPNNQVDMRVEIKDTGIGMSEEFQKHMFEPFTQENQVMTSVSQGTGLGLSIVKKMCDIMNISISVESKIGEGTKYILVSRYDLASKEIVPEGNNTASNGKVHISLKDKTVLVCEDHMLNQEIIKRILEKKGIIVRIVEDGKKGVEDFQKSSPGTYDAILMDIRMPVMDGIEATKIIRALDRSDAKLVPIIAMTANAYEEDKRLTEKVGMNDHISKPIDPEIVYKTIEKQLDKRYLDTE